jgi:hypothetical protein
MSAPAHAFYLTRFHVARFGLEAVPGPRYAIPVPTQCLGLCMACGEEVTGMDFVECACWSTAVRAALPALLHRACFDEMASEW